MKRKYYERQRGRGRHTGLPHGDAAMTFEEIGKCLGITRGGAWMIYKSAMRKLRRLVNTQQEESKK